MNIIVLIILLIIGNNALAVSNYCPKGVSDNGHAAIIGLASDAVSGEPMYCEYHYSQDLGSRFIVEYRNLSQEVIAKKELDYSVDMLKPDVIQQDFRHGELREVVSNQSQSNGIDVRYRKPNKEKTKTANLAVSDKLVIDAGFDQAIRQSWDSLSKGEKVKMDFLSPVHLRKIALTIEMKEGEECSRQQYDQVSQACFLIHPSNVLLNLFVQPLALIYDKQSQRLLVYKGNVNITAEDGSTLKAVIQYHYSDQLQKLSYRSANQ